MTKNATEQKKTRTQYSQSYKDDALALAERIGFAKAAAQLGIFLQVIANSECHYIIVLKYDDIC